MDDLTDALTADPGLTKAVERAESMLLAELSQQFGDTAPPLEWIHRRFDGNALTGVFLAPDAYPLLRFPWWASEGGTSTSDFHADLAYSSIAGYLFVRIVDDLADGDHPVPPAVVPALAFLHTEFESFYHNTFPANRRFWELFRTHWYAAARAAMLDLESDAVTYEQYRNVSARKTQAAIIPVAAALEAVGRADDTPRWTRFIEAFGRWHQFHNDVQGASGDLRHGTATLALTTAVADADDGVSPHAWLWTEGMSWTNATIAAFEEEALDAAVPLTCTGLDHYLAARFARRRERFDRIQSDWNHLKALLAAPDDE